MGSSARARERILEIMKDSHVGAMGVIAIVCTLLVKFAAMASLPPGRLWAAAMLMPLAGRGMMVMLMALLPYAREKGLGNVFYQGKHYGAAVWSVSLLAGMGWMAMGAGGVAAAAACVLATLVFARCCHGKIGGATGDTFGAVCEISEVVVAVVLACRPWQMVR